MANWKVSREIISLSPHYNADSLELANLGGRQYVVKKGLYKEGDIVIQIPEKSILPEDLALPFKSYLSNGNRVKSAKLRGELSEGCIIPDRPELGNVGEDISVKLGIEEFSPLIPAHMSGVMRNSVLPYHKHDCEPFGINKKYFTVGEEVIISEKIHGSLISITKLGNELEITSKGLGKQGRNLEEDENNLYWKAFNQSGLLEIMNSWEYDSLYQIIGEVIPCQKGFNYGLDPNKPQIKVFKFLINGKNQAYADIGPKLKQYWVPILDICPFDEQVIYNYAQGKSTLTDSHIKEGVVVTPIKPRKTIKGFDLILKVISDAYAKKSNGDEFN